jgi:hypothetical protein
MFEYTTTVAAVVLYDMDTTETTDRESDPSRTEITHEERIPQSTVRMGSIGVLLVEAVSFLIGALAHLGIRIPVEIMVLTEPRILPATIVEGICGLVLAGAAYAVFTRKPWSWQAVVAAQAIALGGVVLGIVALSLGGGPNTASNALYHRVMLLLLVGGLVLLSTQFVKSALR